MSERPYIQMHVSSFLADTLIFSTEAIGAYALLLLQAARNDGTLPLDELKLRRLCRLSRAAWSEAWPDIRNLFEERDGFLVSRHLEEWADRERRAKVRKALPPALRTFVLLRDGERCTYCGDWDGPFHIDHKIPVVRGGTDDPENLCVACATCNLSKGAKLLEEWQ